jgi:hypothetical protein
MRQIVTIAGHSMAMRESDAIKVVEFLMKLPLELRSQFHEVLAIMGRCVAEETHNCTTIEVLEKLSLIKPYLKKSEAYRLYGRQTVDRWIKEKLITPIKDRENNGMIRLNRTELEKASLTSNRMSYFNSLPDNEY